MSKLISKNNFFLLFLSLFSLLPLFNIDLLPISAGIYGILILLFLITKKNLSLNLVFLFIFAGTLFSADVGFTFKGSQFFAIFALMNMFIGFCNNEKDLNYFPLRTYFPFILYILLVLPSLCTPILFSEDYESISNIKIFFNYIFLQIICFVIATGLNNKDKIKKAVTLSLYSYLFILGFGILQQIGYYLGVYDPNDYLGKHSLFVDFYGPFLRISPGTFANEFGEIIQSVAIFITTFLLYMKNEISLKVNLYLKSILFISLIALIINFTRASWFVYMFYLVVIFLIKKPSIKTSFLIVTTTLTGLLSIYYINLQTNILSIIPILDRFSELNDLSGSSAGSRLEAWEISYNLFLQSPIIGNGLGIATSTHNVPLQLLAETGIIGFLGFYFLMFFLLNKFYNMIKKTDDLFLKTTSISIFFTLLGCLLFDLTNHGIYHFILWLTIGIGLATDKVIQNKSPKGAPVSITPKGPLILSTEFNSRAEP